MESMVEGNRTRDHPDDKISMIKMLENLHEKYGLNEKELRNSLEKEPYGNPTTKNYNL